MGKSCKARDTTAYAHSKSCVKRNIKVKIKYEIKQECTISSCWRDWYEWYSSFYSDQGVLAFPRGSFSSTHCSYVYQFTNSSETSLGGDQGYCQQMVLPATFLNQSIENAWPFIRRRGWLVWSWQNRQKHYCKKKSCFGQKDDYSRCPWLDCRQQQAIWFGQP